VVRDSQRSRRSLYDVLELSAADFIWLGSVLRSLAMEMESNPELALMSEVYMRSISPTLVEVAARCKILELPVSEQTATHWENEFRAGPIRRFSEGRCAIEEIERTIKNELSDMTCFFLSRESAHECEKMIKALDVMIDRPWPVAFKNLLGAGGCYSYEEFTASVFHSMRAAEKLLTTLASSLTNVDPSREQWHTLIERIEAAIKDFDKLPKGDLRQKKQTVYSETAMQFRYIKNAWRNHVMHSRTDYDEKAAREIWWHVERSLEKICDELPELLEV
jgi:hypothetical protein